MWKIAIFDDDQIILRKLSKGTPWAENGFEVVAVAGNGEDGLEAVERERPHVVLTDIRMPFMDGLELTEKLKESYPDVKIIMMTSFDEFEFAQKALKLKVYDFVLKPLDEKKLIETARRAAEEWEQEQSLAKKVMEGAPFLKQRFFENLLHGKYRPEEIIHELEFLDLSLRSKRYAVILLLADDYYETGARNRYGQELLKYCIRNVAEEVLSVKRQEYPERYFTAVVIEMVQDEMVILYGSEDEESGMEREALRLAETIRDNVLMYLKTTITAGVGSIVDGLEEAASSYRGAKAATEYRHMTGTNEVFLYRDNLLKPKLEGWVTDSAGWKAQLAAKVKSGLEEEALEIIDRLEEEVRSKFPVSLERLHVLGMEMVISLVNAFQDWNDPPYPPNAVETLFQEIGRIRTAKELFERIRVFLRELSRSVRDRRSNQLKNLADLAVAYIKEHYAREGLSLQDVADHVHVSTTYLSTIFKKETGVNFSDYLLEIRMMAAMEWLRKEDLKTYEVAERVGYGNPQYFSVIFKKYTGKTPSEFRQSK